MGRKVLVSACLVGRRCRFDGRDVKNKALIDFLKENKIKYLSLCPEELGGLRGKRGPFELEGKARDILKGKGRVRDIKGKDYTDSFLKGAYRVLERVKKEKITFAILKSKSPSCSCDYIYDGSFKKILIKGLGLAAYLLKKNKLRLFSEYNYQGILNLLK